MGPQHLLDTSIDWRQMAEYGGGAILGLLVLARIMMGIVGR